MKLNFWQWIGIILLVVGAILFMRRRTADQAPQPSAPTTQQTR
ncbi:MAG TPA: hypothetical protein VHP11_04280 [Tepidisphaeraceae bacterium]|nr:hypothetical protein [Tepidisphaeraceae bacterium]